MTISVAGLVAPAHAMSMADCSVKYQAAKKAGTLNGMNWTKFRKTECGTAPTAAKASGDTKGATTSARNQKLIEPQTTSKKAPKGVIFPTAVDNKFSSESPGRARLHTCVEQYRINKANNSLGGLKWIQKGGGYYSICNTRLKG